MSKNIRLATKQDIPYLCEIWKACFPDSFEYIEYFYRENFEHVKAYVCCADGRPVTLAHLFDAVIKDGENEYKAYYAYAGGTLPEYRHHGHFEACIRHLQKTAVDDGRILFLKPSESLISYYQFLGCVKASEFKVITFKPESNTHFEFEDLSYKEYNKMRDAAFSKGTYVKWSDEYVRWCVDENAFFSGKTLKVKIDGKEYFLMAYPKGDELIVNETNLEADLLKQVGGALCDLFAKKTIKAYMPEYCKEGEEEMSSYIYNSELRNYYVNLILT